MLRLLISSSRQSTIKYGTLVVYTPVCHIARGAMTKKMTRPYFMTIEISSFVATLDIFSTFIECFSIHCLYYS